MSFHLSTFITILTLKKTDQIILRKVDDKNTDMIIEINRAHLSHYTDFFSNHNGMVVDNVYTIPFNPIIAAECLYHIHTLFTCFTYKQTLFLLLQVFDYFCVVSSIYMKNIIESPINSIHLYIVDWTNDALVTQNETIIGYLHILYDKMYTDGNLFFFPACTNINVIRFLLSRKWITNKETRTTILAHSQKMENFFLYLVKTYSDTIKNDHFVDLWKLIYPSLLSMDAIMDLSKTSYAKLVKEDIIKESHKRIGLFGESFSLTFTRFTLNPGETHNDIEPFFIKQHLQVMDRRNLWYNASITEIDTTAKTVRVHFERFSDVYDETISSLDFFRFLPYNTLSSGSICPCTYCIRHIFSSSTI